MKESGGEGGREEGGGEGEGRKVGSSRVFEKRDLLCPRGAAAVELKPKETQFENNSNFKVTNSNGRCCSVEVGMQMEGGVHLKR